MRKIDILLNKTLRLNNVICYELKSDELSKPEIVVEKIDNYIKSKGGYPVGPVIQRVSTSINNANNLDAKVEVLRQADRYIYQLDKPYGMEAVLRVKNCIYAHYIGPEEHISISYAKINVISFEKNINIKPETYTIFLKDTDNGDTVADIFVETY